MKQTIKQVCGVLLFALLSLSGYAQKTNGDKIIITGNVIDNTGLGLPGVNVIEKGAKGSTITDIDGKYKIAVNKGAVLSFAFIGMDRVEKVVGNQTVINVTMKDDATVLTEVVVVGYGTQKKGKITGAIETIKPQALQDLPVTNLAESLRGQVTGLSVGGNGSRRPGESATLEIRQNFGFSKDGYSSLPLVVIDDMIQVDPSTGLSSLDSFNRLDPSEIESITVLKDGSAAIYGSRASQGAIIVKTKRGKEGKTKLTYSSQFAINDAVSHGKTMSAYDSGVFNNRILTTMNPTIDTGLLYSPGELDKMKSLNYDWLKKAWKPSEQQKHSLSVSGGNEKATYFGGITYLEQGANLGDQNYEKWNYRAGIDAKITKDLDLSFAVSGNNGDIEKSFTKASGSIRNGFAGASTSAEQADYGLLLHMPKFIPITITKGGQEYFTSPFPRSNVNLGNTQNSNSSIAGWNYFALLDSGSKQVNSDFSYNVNGALTYRLPFVKGLSFKGTYAKTQNASRTEQNALPYTLARITNFYSSGENHLASEAIDSKINIADNVRNARIVYDNNTSKSIQSNFFVTYARTFGDHDLDAMVGVERSESEYTSTRLLYDNPTKNYLGTSVTAGTLNVGNSYSDKGEQGTMSYMGRLNYSYKSKYLFQLIFREDASTKFAPENYWGFFPSVQAGWVVSEENWFKNNVSWVDYFKLRYSIGKTGKDNIKPWRWALYYDIATDKGVQFGSNGGTLSNAIVPRVSPNRNVGWDTNWKQNYGIDFNVFKNRLKITAEYYIDKSTDMLIPLSNQVGIPFSVGGGFAEENYAAVNSWGTEFSVNWNDRIKDNLSYNVGVNFGFSGNEVKKYPDPGYTQVSTNTIREGSSYYNPVWGFKVWDGTSTGDGILRTDADVANYWKYLTDNAAAVGGKPNFLNITDVANLKKGMLAYQDLGGAFDSTTGVQAAADGKIEKNNDYGKLAKSNRTYGFTTNLGMKYEGFYFRSQISTSWGGYQSIDNVTQYTGSSDGFYAREPFWNDMYAADNVNGKYPSLAFKDYTAFPSDFWSVNTFRCVVRNLTVGFELPQQVLSALKVDKVSIGVTGNNLWDLYNPYPDHYRNMYDDSLSGYPTLRTWTVNLNVTF